MSLSGAVVLIAVFSPSPVRSEKALAEINDFLEGVDYAKGNLDAWNAFFLISFGARTSEVVTCPVVTVVCDCQTAPPMRGDAPATIQGFIDQVGGMPEGFPLGSPDTLEKLTRLWNHCNQVLFVRVVDSVENGVAFRGQFSSARAGIAVAECLEAAESHYSAFTTMTKEKSEAAAQFELRESAFPIHCDMVASAMDGERLYLIPVKTRLVEVNGIEALNWYCGKEWRKTSFETAFPALHSYYDLYGGAPLSFLQTAIESESRLVGDRFKVLGMEVPRKTIVGFGVLVLAGAQLYFFLHLSALVARSRQSQPATPIEIPWIGTYSQSSAKIATWLSAVLMPLAVELLILMFGYADSAWALVSTVLALASSGSLLYLLTRALNRAWRQLSYGPSSPTGPGLAIETERLSGNCHETSEDADQEKENDS